MRQALHIFRKDIRHLRIEIALVLAVLALFVFIHTSQAYWQTRPDAPQSVAAFVVAVLLPISWWLLIVRAVHGENLVGDREFWQTRPYSWRSLLAARLLLILLVLNAPMFVAQALILRDHGFPLGEEFAPLLWNQALLLGAFFLPVAAIAALTSGVAQFLVIGLAAWGGLVLFSLRFSLFAAALAGGFWGPMEWVRSYYALFVAAVAASAILVWQYAERRTTAARIAAGVAVVVVGLGVPLSWTQAFAVQTRFSRRPAAAADVRAGWNTSLRWMTRALVQASGRGVNLSVPLQFTGVPGDLDAKPEGLAFLVLEAPGGAVWRAEGPPARLIASTGQLVSLRANMDESSYRRLRDQPVAVRGSVFLTLYGNSRETRLPISGSAQPVPGMGRCAATGGSPAPYFLSCFWALRPRADRISVQFETPSGRIAERRARSSPSYSPFPAELSIDPLTPSADYSTFQGPLDAVTVFSEEPVAYLQAPLLIEGLRLSDFEVRSK